MVVKVAALKPEIFAEVVIRPNDSRPIVVKLLRDADGSPEVEMSGGLLDDAQLAVDVLHFMNDAMAEIMWERLKLAGMSGYFRSQTEDTPVDTGDLPF